jgi:DNA-binding HxlR family transcriptional regulator
MLVKHKKAFKEISDSDQRIAPSILSARFKLLESYKLIYRTKMPENKKENIYLLTEKGIRLTPIIIEFSLWGNSKMRAFNKIDDIEGLNSDKTLIIQTVPEYTEFLCPVLINVRHNYDAKNAVSPSF